MKISYVFKKLTLREKIYQMFVLGFDEGNDANTLSDLASGSFTQSRQNILNAIKNNLGGVIFFAKNLNKRIQFEKLVVEMQKTSKIGLFTSIDQEGGLVERTICLDKKVHYLTPMALAASNNLDLTKKHTQIMAEDLKSLGINMNFAPVLDVNTNPNNPIIGIRAFSKNSNDVSLYSQKVIEEFAQYGIVPVGKHFPGHGEAFVDSHKDLPQIDLSMSELEKIHINPFKTAIEQGLDAVMVAHVYFSAFDNIKIPASLSRNVIDYLRQDLNFNGLAISDDMVMGGIANHYTPVDACLEAIFAGINLFIFRGSDNETLSMIEEIVRIASKDKELQEKIDISVQKILEMKEKYDILNMHDLIDFDVDASRKVIEDIACQAYSNQPKISLQRNKKYLILSPDKSAVYNYSFDDSKLSDFIEFDNIIEKKYPLNPLLNEISELVAYSQNFDEIIFVSYNAIFNEGQKALFQALKAPCVLLCAGVPYDKEFLNPKNSVLFTFGFNSTALNCISKCFSVS